MSRWTALLPVAAVVLLSGCVTDTSGCIPTQTSAADGAKIDLGAPGGSATLLATLTAEGMPVTGRVLRFDVLADGSTVYDDDASTGDNGVASVDLKQVDAGAVTGLARADEFQASFPGDDAYCASSGSAAVEVVGAPVP